MAGASFSFSASVGYNDERVGVLVYCLITSAVVGLQILSAHFLLKRAETSNPNLISKLSLTTVAICNIEDFYLTMVHVEYIMASGVLLW